MSQEQDLPYGLMAELARVPKGRPPPVHLWEPENRHAIDMHINASGDWYHEGTLIARPRLVRLLASVLKRIDRAYYLMTPVEACQITVEDAPFLALTLASTGEGQSQQLSIVTNVGDDVEIGPQHPLTFRWNDGAPVPYVEVREGLFAKFNRPCYYDCMARLKEVGRAGSVDLGVWSGGLFYAMPKEDAVIDGVET